jgi:hypothetical protein
MATYHSKTAGALPPVLRQEAATQTGHTQAPAGTRYTRGMHQALHMIASVTLITEKHGRPVPPHTQLAGLVSLAYPTGHRLRLRLRSLKRQKIVLHYLIDTRRRMNDPTQHLPKCTAADGQLAAPGAQLRWPPQVHP